MTATSLSIIELGLLVFGAVAALRFTRWVARDAGRGVVLMAAVTAWAILFGILPFFAFAIFAEGASSSARGVAGWESLVLNLIPFALVAAPLAGFAQGLKASKPGTKESASL